MPEKPVVEVSEESVPVYCVGWPVTVSIADAYSIAQHFGRLVDRALTSRARGAFPDRADPFGYLNIERGFLGARVVMKNYDESLTFGSDRLDRYMTWAAVTLELRQRSMDVQRAVGFELGFMSGYIMYEDLRAVVEGHERRRRKTRRPERDRALQPEMSLTSHVRWGKYLVDLILRTNSTIDVSPLEALAKASLTKLPEQL